MPNKARRKIYRPALLLIIWMNADKERVIINLKLLFYFCLFLPRNTAPASVIIPAKIELVVSNPVLANLPPLVFLTSLGVRGCPPGSIGALPFLSLALDQSNVRMASCLPPPGIMFSIVWTNTETGI